jgi:hypothetical protein
MVKVRTLLLLIVVISLLDSAARAADSGIDYLQPKVLTGTVYSDASLKQALFTFRRSATNSGFSIYVLREFRSPNGAVVAKERVVYEGSEFKSYLLEQLQTGARGSAVVKSAGGETKLNFDYTLGASKKTGSEKFQEGMLVGDMLVPYVDSHWDALAAGKVVKCRLVALSRAETVGFKLFKDSETTWRGNPAVIVKMEPSSIIIARLVAPLYFIIEKGSPHRVFQYTGRTTPYILRNGKWKDLDATTVFDW